MRVLRLVLFALIGTLVAPAAHAQVTSAEARAGKNVTLLKPISDWNIDYGDNRCRLLRVFGSEEERHVVFFVQSSPGSSFGMTLAGPEMRPFANSRRSYMGLRDDAVMRKLDRAGRGDVNGFGIAMILSSFSLGQTKAEEAMRTEEERKLRFAGIDLDKADTAEHVTLKLNRRVLSFETGPLRAPFEALNTCTRSMLTEWGLDPEQHRQYRPPRWSNLKKVSRFISQQYPKEALRKGESAIFQMRLIVEPDGRVSNCHLEKNTIAQSLASPACQVTIKNAEFKPALDADGKPMRSFYSTTITYTINS